jgi:hypothetical protein
MTDCEKCVHNRVCCSLKAGFSDEALKEFRKILYGPVELGTCDFFRDSKVNVVHVKQVHDTSVRFHEDREKLYQVNGMLEVLSYILPDDLANAVILAIDRLNSILGEEENNNYAKDIQG